MHFQGVSGPSQQAAALGQIPEVVVVVPVVVIGGFEGLERGVKLVPRDQAERIKEAFSSGIHPHFSGGFQLVEPGDVLLKFASFSLVFL